MKQRIYPKTIEEFYAKLSEAKGGEHFVLQYAWDKEVLIKFICPPADNPIIIDGDHAGQLLGGLSVMDCHNLFYKRLYVENTINLNDSYPETGLFNIHFEDVKQKYGSRGVFLGGSNVSGLYFDGCSFTHQIGGYHSAYMSGGHWGKINPKTGELYPPVSNIHFKRCIMGMTPAGRNCLQFNGRFKDVSAKECSFHHPELNHISVIGVQGGQFLDNVGYGGNRGTGVVLYDYASSWAPYYGWFETDASIEKFNKEHHPNKDILVANNTWVVGPNQFSYAKEWGHYNEPHKHPALHVNNAIHSGFSFWHDEKKETIHHSGWSFPNDKFYFVKNLCYTLSEKPIFIEHKQEAEVSHLVGNWFYTPKTGLPYIGALKYAAELNGNLFEEIKFIEGLPKYGGPINMVENPDYDWSQFQSHFNAYCRKADRFSIGKQFPVPVFASGISVAELGKCLETPEDFDADDPCNAF